MATTPKQYLVHTPDLSLNHRGFANSWWSPGESARGMPYQWGGFDTPREFLTSIAGGEAAGDILLNNKHVLLFAGWDDTQSVLAYEAGPFPVWRVNAANIPVSKLEREGYNPWRYRGILD